MQISDNQHTCILNVFGAAANVCSRCQGNIRKRKSSRTSIDVYFRSAHTCCFMNVLTNRLLFAQKSLGLGRYILNLRSFFCNARPNCNSVYRL